MHRRGARLERLVRSRHRDAALADGLDLVGPRIDERHIVAGTRQERSEVASDGSGADEEQLLAHVSPPSPVYVTSPPNFVKGNFPPNKLVSTRAMRRRKGKLGGNLVRCSVTKGESREK